MVTHQCNPSPCKAEVGDVPRVYTSLGYTESQSNLSYSVKPCFKRKKEKLKLPSYLKMGIFCLKYYVQVLFFRHEIHSWMTSICLWGSFIIITTVLICIFNNFLKSYVDYWICWTISRQKWRVLEYKYMAKMCWLECIFDRRQPGWGGVCAMSVLLS